MLFLLDYYEPGVSADLGLRIVQLQLQDLTRDSEAGSRD
jgi:hypothetical protein